MTGTDRHGQSIFFYHVMSKQGAGFYRPFFMTSRASETCILCYF